MQPVLLEFFVTFALTPSGLPLRGVKNFLRKFFGVAVGGNVRPMNTAIHQHITQFHVQFLLSTNGLSSLSIDLGQLLTALAGKLPRHPILAALLGRLAVAQTAQDQGIGRMLLADAVKRTLSVSEQIGIHALVVDAMDHRAQTFYQQFGYLIGIIGLSSVPAVKVRLIATDTNDCDRPAAISAVIER